MKTELQDPYEQNLFNLCLQLFHAATGDDYMRQTANCDIERWRHVDFTLISVYMSKRFHFKVKRKGKRFFLFEDFEGFESGNYVDLIRDELGRLGYNMPLVFERPWKFNSALKPNENQ